MAKIIQLSAHVANLIAAGEVVERPASVVKELLENAVDAGATQVTIEIRGGGMTFIRVTDNGCGMSPEDARTAFLRHATSKLRTKDDLAAISTMGFRGEALAAIASVSRIDLLTKTADSLSGTSLTLEAGQIIDESEAGCPDGTTIIIRDLFFNTPARMKFMKADTVEGSKVSASVQLQALAHPEVAFRYIRDGKEVLSTPGTGNLDAAVYCIYGRDSAKMVAVNSNWDSYTLTGCVSKPTEARPSRNLQTFFVNDRPVKSRLMMAALEEAYRNQLMVGKFPACVLHLRLPANLVDVNVHPAKTEVKFLNEKAVFDCIHYGVLGALNRTNDRPQVEFRKSATPSPEPSAKSGAPVKQENFFRTMTSQEFKNFTTAIKEAPRPHPENAAATVAAIEKPTVSAVRQTPARPVLHTLPPLPEEKPLPTAQSQQPVTVPQEPEPARQNFPTPEPEMIEQVSLPMPEGPAWRLVGELYRSYILVEEGDNAYLIDKHAAHERILFDKLKANQEAISAQTLLTPIPCRLRPDAAGALLNNRELLLQLGFEVDPFGESTVLLRQIPMDLSQDDAADAMDAISADLLNGRLEKADTVRDEILHTVACKAAIKAGWQTDEQELLALVSQVMAREDLKYCPHGRPICITLSKKQLEKQFKRA